MHGIIVQFILGEASPCDKGEWPRKSLHNYDFWLIFGSRRGQGTGNLSSLYLMLNNRLLCTVIMTLWVGDVSETAHELDHGAYRFLMRWNSLLVESGAF